MQRLRPAPPATLPMLPAERRPRRPASRHCSLGSRRSGPPASCSSTCARWADGWRRGGCASPECARAPGDWQQRLDGLAARLRISKPVALLESCLAEVPVVIGYARPVILMPVGLLAGLPVAQVEAILIHELAHIRRQDYLVNLMQTFIEGLLFYHPAVWWISGVIRAERENCCDDLAVAVTGDARQYAAALAALEQNRWAAHELALAANWRKSRETNSTSATATRAAHAPLGHPCFQPASWWPALESLSPVGKRRRSPSRIRRLPP